MASQTAQGAQRCAFFFAVMSSFEAADSSSVGTGVVAEYSPA
jgi:hypothetical protein